MGPYKFKITPDIIFCSTPTLTREQQENETRAAWMGHFWIKMKTPDRSPITCNE